MTRKFWKVDEVVALFHKPFFDLLFEAQTIHRQHFNPNKLQISRLLSIKTGRCSEDCKYCSQSVRHKTGLEAERLMEVNKVVEAAKVAKAEGATRFCMGAAWRNPSERDMPYIKQMIEEVKGLGLETCMTLGQLNESQASELADSGLDYYNHNLDTSPEFYGEIVTTHTYQNRLDTLEHVRKAGMKICSGGIVGLGENERDRASLLVQLVNMDEPPESLPINRLIPIKGTPLQDAKPVDDFDFVRTIAVARIVLPKAMIRLSAGRESMSDELQALCFLAGANSLFYGAKLLTSANVDHNRDDELFKRLNLTTLTSEVKIADA